MSIPARVQRYMAAVDFQSLDYIYNKLRCDSELPADVAVHEIVMAYIQTLYGFEIRAGIGGTGVIGVLRNSSGPTVLLRAEMYSIQESPYGGTGMKSDLEAQIERDVMHTSCINMSCMLIAAACLCRMKSFWQGTLVLLFQPNGGRGSGASAMIRDGLYDPRRYACPIPDVVLGQHCLPFEAGKVGTRKGIAGPAVDSYRVTVYGKGGHASQPHMAIDPVPMAAKIIIRLQEIPSRELDSQDAAVVTAGVVAGTTEDIIADEAVLKLDIRYFNTESRQKVFNLIQTIVQEVCNDSNATKEPLFEITRSLPFLINDVTITQQLSDCFDTLFGEDHVRDCALWGGSEDFNMLAMEAPNKRGGKGVPSCFWLLGSANAAFVRRAKEQGELEHIPIHHDPLCPPVKQPTIKTGVEALVAAALRFLSTR